MYLLKGHENIIEIFEIFEEIDCIIIITELLEGGDLYMKLKEIKYFIEKEALVSFVQLIEAMKYMKLKHVVHRDIKLDNVLLVKNNIKDNPIQLKIADFGFADIVKSNSLLKTRCGTPGLRKILII